MNQPAPPSWGPPRQPDPYQQWPVGYGPYVLQAAPPPQESTVFRYVALACGTLLVIGALVLVGLMLIPRAAAPVVVAGSSAPAPLVATVTAPSTATGGSSCGTTASGHSVTIVNGTVPCDHAVTVATQWLSSGTTPGYGEGSAGTMYSWTCTTTTSGGGWCTSKMGSHLSISS
ncbi:hypothetical protein LQ327_22360 [Actinomycetospora endophytica]|uniref:Ig-like domain-containing protein n=1 Tax=Actinomycetospora endophytica TaxID=2291215 RepID=A0ABS8PGJ6_9PSEU|nr:hypothetical protein [Actinomycetospora endophytica]MCD2196119.1 hypothetical protein [Actinomycetospora endophytica]